MRHHRHLLAGTGVGFLTGLFGVGGGFVIVPALTLLLKLSMPEAIGTSLVVIAMNTLAGYAGYHGTMDIPWTVVLGFGGIAVNFFSGRYSGHINHFIVLTQ